MNLIDFHCHVDLYPDPAVAVASIVAQGIYTLSVTTTPRAWPQNLQFTQHAPRIRVALGLHPQLVASRAEEIKIWEKYLPEARYIGEVGIDASPEFYQSLDLQKQIFEHILKKCASTGEKIITVHSLRSSKMVLDLIEKYFPPSRGTIILHWFTGSQSDAHRAVDLGCYFSVNTAMLGNDKGRALVAMLPSKRLLTETDGPFMSINNRPARPADVVFTIEKLASLLSISTVSAAEIVMSNLRTLHNDAVDWLD